MITVPPACTVPWSRSLLALFLIAHLAHMELVNVSMKELLCDVNDDCVGSNEVFVMLEAREANTGVLLSTNAFFFAPFLKVR